jgi:ferrochelatase
MIIGVLLLILGTPNSPSTPDVRKYLREFLMDGRVIDIPYIPRFLLVNGIIAPFRAPKSAKVYRQVWLPEGSPLKVYGVKLTEKVKKNLGDNFVVRLAMRYQNPSIALGLEELMREEVSQIIVVPLFPQYASASSGSVYEEVMHLASKIQTIPALTIAGTFFDADFFIQPIVDQIKEVYSKENYDQILFSYHGLPERHIRKGDRVKCCLKEGCCDTLGSHNQLCYRAQCFATTRLIASKLNLGPDQYTTSFQSRLGNDPWVKPYTDQVIKKWPEKGINKVLALSPSFVADCLETTEEIGSEYKEIFEEAGGKHWELLPCLNDNETFAAGLSDWIFKMSISPKQNIPAVPGS